mmetsp:Transcript_34817/g.84143  ORF Transcript_34817/g.84143 Transcript_34817/m.84143 type:complete len:208 (-) Transcript_34817:576-1199(-)
MAPAAVPFSKLASLLIKTLAKPMAKQVKHHFVKQPITRRFLIQVGQTAHGVTTRMTIWSSGFKVRSISKLEEEAALSRGADLLSETFIFSVSMFIVIYEYNRSSEKEKKKEEARLQKIRDDATRLQAKLNSLDKRLVSLEEYAKANRRSIVLGIGVGANAEYHQPDEVVPIHDVEVDETNAINENKNDSSTRKNSIEKRKGSRWWPF